MLLRLFTAAAVVITGVAVVAVVAVVVTVGSDRINSCKQQ